MRKKAVRALKKQKPYFSKTGEKLILAYVTNISNEDKLLPNSLWSLKTLKSYKVFII